MIEGVKNHDDCVLQEMDPPRAHPNEIPHSEKVLSLKYEVGTQLKVPTGKELACDGGNVCYNPGDLTTTRESYPADFVNNKPTKVMERSACPCLLILHRGVELVTL